jgi:hypothetical protein
MPAGRITGEGLAFMRPRGWEYLAVVFLAVVARAATVLGQEVERIEPPSWWVEREAQGLMLLVEGSGLSGAKVRATRGPIRVDRVEEGRQGRALFVEVTVLGGSLAGRCEIEIATGGRTIRRDWELVTKPERRPEPFGPDDVIYLAMVARFSNGDPVNDEAGGGDRMLDRRDPHAYHGGDFAGLHKRLLDLGRSWHHGSLAHTDLPPRADMVRDEPREHATKDGRLPWVLPGRLLRHQRSVRLAPRLSRVGGQGPPAWPEGDPGPDPWLHWTETPLDHPPADR